MNSRFVCLALLFSLVSLQAARAQKPLELIAAVPVASADRLPLVKQWCDEIVCLAAPDDFMAVGEYYDDFHQLDDAEAAALLLDFTEEIPVTASK